VLLDWGKLKKEVPIRKEKKGAQLVVGGGVGGQLWNLSVGPWGVL